MLNNNVSYLSESLSFACWLSLTTVTRPRRIRHLGLKKHACEMHAKDSQQAKLKDSER